MDVKTTENPERSEGVLSRIVFSFLNPLIGTGHRKKLEVGDLLGLKRDERAENTGVSLLSALGDLKGERPDDQKSLARAIFSVYWPSVIIAGLLGFGSVMCSFIYVFLLRYIVEYIEDDDVPSRNGYIYVALFFIVPFIGGTLQAHSDWEIARAAYKIWSGLSHIIYRKAMRISHSGLADSTQGQIQNLMSTDCEEVYFGWTSTHHCILYPVQIVLAVALLYSLLGPAALIGFGSVFVVLPCAGVISGLILSQQLQKLQRSDERVKLTNELLLGIRILKYYAWEERYGNIVLELRDKEMESLTKLLNRNVLLKATIFITPLVIILTTFISYSALGNDLEPRVVFPALALFHILRYPLVFLPISIVNVLRGNISLKRIFGYFFRGEVGSRFPECSDETLAVVCDNVDFAWRYSKDREEKSTDTEEKKSFVLCDVNLEIKKSEFAAVVGPVGVGKSSLLEGILGEMCVLNGNVSRTGSVAYVSQEPFIKNATVKDNILFGKPFEPVKFEKVLEACALKEDMKQLPGGFMTEIGEKGINLSGGQKARISLARACYADCDVYIMDDPFSAVDAHVGRHMLEEVVLGLLVKKTRILATSQSYPLEHSDIIVVLQEGRVASVGSYSELEGKGFNFEALLPDHEKDDVEEQDVVVEMEDEGEKEEQVVRRRSRRWSRRTSGKKSVKDGLKEIMKNAELTEIEETGTGTSSSKLLFLYAREAGGFIFVFFVVLLYILTQIFATGTDVWLTWWIEREFGDRGFAFYALIYVGIAVLAVLFSYIRGVYFVSGALIASRRLHNGLLWRVLAYCVPYFDVTPTGRILNRFARDIGDIDIPLPSDLETVCMLVFWFIAPLILIALILPWFALALLPMALIYIYIQRYYIPTSKELRKIHAVARSPLFSHFSECLGGLSTIRAYEMENNFLRENMDRVDKMLNPELLMFLTWRWMDVRVTVINSFVIGFASLFCVLSRDSLDPSMAGLALSSAISMLGLLGFVVLLSGFVETNLACVDRISDYSNRPVEKVLGWTESDSVDPKWPQRGDVEFKDVQLKYRENLDFALKGLSFNVTSGQKVGIVGRTGAGKSTVMVALFRIVELVSGSVTIDGVDISSISLPTLRSRLTIIPQDPVLFSGTVRVNLDPFGEYDDKDVWSVLECVQMKSKVENRSGALDTEVAEGGLNFSVGERQLFCLARALLKQSRIILLDEATADIDSESDRKIQHVVRERFRDATVLTVAHRLNTVIDSDVILVLRNGTLVESGTPAALLENHDSIFWSMVQQTGSKQARWLELVAQGKANLFVE